MGRLTRVLEKSGYGIDLDCFVEQEVEVEFLLAEEEPIDGDNKSAKPEEKDEQGSNRRLDEGNDGM